MFHDNGVSSVPGYTATPTEGLDHLVYLDKIHLVPDTDAMKRTTNCTDCRSRFLIKDSYGETVYKALEETDVWMKLCCRTCRDFVIVLTDNFGHIKLNIEYLHSFSLFVIPSCSRLDKNTAKSITVTSLNGALIGRVIKAGGYYTKFDVQDDTNCTKARLITTDCSWQCCWLPQEFAFDIIDEDEISVGSIVRKFHESDNGSASYLVTC